MSIVHWSIQTYTHGHTVNDKTIFVIIGTLHVFTKKNMITMILSSIGFIIFLGQIQHYDAVSLKLKELLILLFCMIPFECLNKFIDGVVSGKIGDVDFNNNPFDFVNHLNFLF